MDGQIAHRLPDAADPFFTRRVHDADPDVAGALDRELGRQRDEIELIASENIVSRAVLDAVGSVLTNKYARGLSGSPLLRRLPAR